MKGQPKARHEFLLMLVNRGSAPAATFVALSLIQRLISAADFTNFLLLFSFSQWLLAFGYQWQKNLVVKFFYYENYLEISRICILIASLLAFLAILMYGFIHLEVLPVCAGMYLVTFGVLYYVSTNYRMVGSIRRYANLDTLFQVLRWVGAVAPLLVIRDQQAVFGGMSAVLAVAVGCFLWLWVSSPSVDKAAIGRKSVLSWKTYVSVGLWLAAFDFAGAGLMYVDRFYVSDASYILHSTIANQVLYQLSYTGLARHVSSCPLRRKPIGRSARPHLDRAGRRSGQNYFSP